MPPDGGLVLDLLDQGVPLAAGGTAAHPFRRAGTAALADENGLVFHPRPPCNLGLFTSRGGCRWKASKGEAVLILVKKRGLGLRTLCNEADAAGSVCPKGENAALGPSDLTEECGVFMNSPSLVLRGELLHVGETGVLADEGQLEVADRAVPLLGDADLGDALEAISSSGW